MLRRVMCKQLRKAIRELMRRAWLDNEPGPNCFDRDEINMALLMDFQDRRLPARDAHEVRMHLLTCSRCRYVYSITRKTSRPEPTGATP
jgi:hypothetical protein